MSLECEHVGDLFGLSGTFPRPGWVVIDAARDHRFTGELLFDVDPEARVFFDRGTIYLAERTTDPSLGARLVDAGALNAAQLEHGSMRIGDTEHLGRLFERVPSVDRQTTIVITEMMNDSCVGWLARQSVRGVVSTPYRHHPAGIHRWERSDDVVDLRPGDPLPAPAPTAAPIEVAPPESVFSGQAYDNDPLIHWDEPSWLDDRPGETGDDQPSAAHDSATSRDVARSSRLDDDWVDQLEWAGLPEPGADPLTPTVTLPTLPVEPADRFELIWPSGHVDADFPTSIDGSDDLDRAGPTARVARSAAVRDHDIRLPLDDAGLWDFEASRPSFGPDDEPPVLIEEAGEPEVTDDVALSVRRAVASIETGSLAARRRLAEAPMADDSSRGNDLVIPGRVATRTEASLWSATRTEASKARSVFDEPDAGPSAPRPTIREAKTRSQPSEPARVSALRRLIDGLRRR
jgi:hypothetical protein